MTRQGGVFVPGLLLALMALSTFACTSAPATSFPAPPESPSPAAGREARVTLVTGGYGYEVGDIVLVDTQKEPGLGDVVQYDAAVNRSNCGAFGPGVYLAMIIGKPGDKVSFGVNSFTANGYSGSFPYGPNMWPRTKPTMWGASRYEDAANMELAVPENEYLADKLVGQECTGETDEHGSSKFYSRFTIKRGAVKGILLKKVGYDQDFAERQKHIVY